MKAKSKAYISLHIAILFFGATAVLGDLIVLDAMILVWWRLILSLVAFIPIFVIYNLFQFWKELLYVKKELILVGIFLALHWVTFFASVKLANASVAVLCLSATSLMTSFMEPIIIGRRFRKMEFAFGALIIPGMILVVESLKTDMMQGVIWGLGSAFLASLFTTYNKKIVDRGNTVLFTFAELLIALVVVTVLVPIYAIGNDQLTLVPVSGANWLYLLILSIVCTTICYTVAFRALRYMSAFTANLSINLEPVYGIILAWIILGDNEEVTSQFYWGAAFIIGIVLGYPFIARKFYPEMSEMH
ncbi:DMT family transporter [Membranihabitans maritimus]|uniref:DMT family transporter n=1 Tax=Membranihabitans maritimus TaxID=2904244 RepID=UPI001F344289